MITMRFSVIIPLYNKAPYVGKALQSVLDQTFTDYELIVVDDGSMDGSARVAEEVLSKAAVDCQLIRQENAGVSAARNSALLYDFHSITAENSILEFSKHNSIRDM